MIIVSWKLGPITMYIFLKYKNYLRIKSQVYQANPSYHKKCQANFLSCCWAWGIKNHKKFNKIETQRKFPKNRKKNIHIHIHSYYVNKMYNNGNRNHHTRKKKPIEFQLLDKGFVGGSERRLIVSGPFSVIDFDAGIKMWGFWGKGLRKNTHFQIFPVIIILTSEVWKFII